MEGDYERDSNYGRTNARNNQRLAGVAGSGAPAFDVDRLEISNEARPVSGNALVPRVNDLEVYASQQGAVTAKGFAAIDQRLRRIEEALGL